MIDRIVSSLKIDGRNIDLIEAYHETEERFMHKYIREILSIDEYSITRIHNLTTGVKYERIYENGNLAYYEDHLGNSTITNNYSISLKNGDLKFVHRYGKAVDHMRIPMSEMFDIAVLANKYQIYHKMTLFYINKNLSELYLDLLTGELNKIK